MSVRKYVTVWCDFDSGVPCVAFLETGEHTAAKARKVARQEGWWVGIPGGNDLCPRHNRRNVDWDKVDP